MVSVLVEGACLSAVARIHRVAGSNLFVEFKTSKTTLFSTNTRCTLENFVSYLLRVGEIHGNLVSFILESYQRNLFIKY